MKRGFVRALKWFAIGMPVGAALVLTILGIGAICFPTALCRVLLWAVGSVCLALAAAVLGQLVYVAIRN